MQTKLLIEQHFHGCFGIDFNKASVDDILYLSKEILKYGIGGIFPTIVTDSIENTKRVIKNIKEASQKQTSDMAKILGIHLEGIFINPERKGIHNPEHFLAPTIENYKLIEDDFIKIVTLAPELVAVKQLSSQAAKSDNGEILQEQLTDKNRSTIQPFNPSTNNYPSPQPSPSRGEGACHDSPSTFQPFNPSTDKDLSPYRPIALSPNNSHTSIPPYLHTSNLINYLTSQGIKVQAGHCTGGDLTGCSGVTHLFNAMSGITHRGKSTALSALINDDIYTEIIADGIHVSDDALKLLFKAKPLDKIILISDCLPCTKIEGWRTGGMEVWQFNNSNSSETSQTQQTDKDLSPYRHIALSPSIMQFTFADETIYYDGEKATSKEGTLAGSTTLLPDIIKRLAENLEGWRAGGLNVWQLPEEQRSEESVNAAKQLSSQAAKSDNSRILKVQQTDKNSSTLQPFNLSTNNIHTSIAQLITNPYTYHNIDLNGSIEWDEDWNIIKIQY